MPARRVAPYGSWKSPITSDAIVAGVVGLGEPRLADGDVYWLEMRPQEGGRSVVVRRAGDGRVEDVTPRDFNARTRAHEYGGGAYAVSGGAVYFTNFRDQRLYRQPLGGAPEAISPEGDARFADFVVDAARGRLIGVVEDHRHGDPYPVNGVAALPLGGGEPVTLAGGYDFYSDPRLNPDGTKLSWLAWNHPDMPWDSTELWVADVAGDGTLVNARKAAGGFGESLYQPEWSPDGTLYYVCDRTGWWNIYRLGEDEPLVAMEAEFGVPQWVFGRATYAFESSEIILCAHSANGAWRLARIDTRSRILTELDLPWTSYSYVRAEEGRAAFVAGSATSPTSVVLLDLDTLSPEVARKSTSMELDDCFLSRPEPIEFPTEGGLTAHALYYPPANCDFRGPGGGKPPLLVHSHGGPTSAASSTLSLSTQYWTSRGFAVVDVNYGGSTGYGRAYRERLNGNWGIVDVDDCCNAARYLARKGLADGGRLAIAGGSAGGYTTLCALAFRDVFAAGASHFGVSDAAALARETHKFEARYLDRLIGPYPQERGIYAERSPINFADRLSAPVIFFQGLEDRIVPPDQAELMVAVLEQKGVPVAYVAFEGEQHGFRQARHIKRALDGEFYFYSRVFGFEPADEIEPVPIRNGNKLKRPRG